MKNSEKVRYFTFLENQFFYYFEQDYEKAIDHNLKSDSEQAHSHQNIKNFLNAQFKIKQTENLFDENKEYSNSDDDDELLKALQKNKNKEEEETEVHQRVQLTNRTSMKHQDFENFEKREERKKLKEAFIEKVVNNFFFLFFFS